MLCVLSWPCLMMSDRFHKEACVSCNLAVCLCFSINLFLIISDRFHKEACVCNLAVSLFCQCLGLQS